MPRKVIIDVDTGVDDAQAIMLALSRPDIDVLAITCVSGNVDVEKVCINTLKVLKVCNRLNIPVYKGASSALTGEHITASHYHGKDGLGDAGLHIDVDPRSIERDPAANALVNLANTYPGEITLVALAPLTNVALALKLDPDFGKKLKNVTIMGGNTEGKGNTTHTCAEFNFGCDPEAAFVVLNGLHTPITIYPWEINLSEDGTQPWEWYDKWVNTDTEKGHFLKAISRKTSHIQRENRKHPFFRSCDMSAMVTMVDPKTILESKKMYATVELNGHLTRGMMVIDWRGILNKDTNVTIVGKLDTARARELFDGVVVEQAQL